MEYLCFFKQYRSFVMMRRAARTDENQASIVGALRACGALVWVLGLPVDLLVGHRGKLALFEVKKPKGSRLTQLQVDFLADWGGRYPVYIVKSEQEAIEALSLMSGVIPPQALDKTNQSTQNNAMAKKCEPQYVRSEKVGVTDA